MRNVNIKVKDTKATIEIDLTALTVLSKEKKSDVIASTSGNVTIGTLPDGRPIKLGLNCYTPIKPTA